MSAKSTFVRVMAFLLLFSLLLAACAPAPVPTPQTVIQTQVVEVPVKETVIVSNEVIITPTPEPTQPVEPVEITYYTFSAADHLEDLDQMIQLFQAQYPNIKVKVETAPFNDYFIKLQTLIAGGTAPDVFELNYENFVTYAEKGLLLDLSSSMSADSTLDPAIYYPRAMQAFSYNGMQLGLPATFSTVVMYYNKDLFDKAGLAYPSADWTWADAVEAGKKLNDPANGVWGLYSGIQFWEFYKKAAQNNCKFFNEDKTEVLINSPECVQALETMVNMVKTEKVVPSSAEMGGLSDGDLFTQGKLAMDVTGIWMFSAYKDAPFQWDITVEPGMATKASHFFANAASVFAATKHPQEAYEWVKFFTSNAEMARIRVASGWELPALNNPEFFTDYLSQTPPANRQSVFDSLEFAVVPPVIGRQSEMQDGVNKLLEQVMLDQLTPQEALDQAKALIEGLLK
jgi:multiple sugar transport system substrate-binding protein